MEQFAPMAEALSLGRGRLAYPLADLEGHLSGLGVNDKVITMKDLSLIHI